MAKLAKQYDIDDTDYGTHADGTPRRVPIRLVSAFESLIYWFIIFVPLLWLFGHFWQPMMDATLTGPDGKEIIVQVAKDPGAWFDRKVLITIVGWLPFGLAANALIRLANKYILRTAWTRPSKVRGGLTGASRSRKVAKGYTPPKEYS